MLVTPQDTNPKRMTMTAEPASSKSPKGHEFFFKAFAEVVEAKEAYADMVRQQFHMPTTPNRVMDEDVEMMLFLLGYNSEFYPDSGGKYYNISQALFDLDCFEDAIEKIRALLEKIQVERGEVNLITPATREHQRRQGVISKFEELLDASVEDARKRMAHEASRGVVTPPAPKKAVGTLIKSKEESVA